MLLERDSVVPLYYQLFEQLRAKIKGGEWWPGEQIPTEKQIAALYDVSLITVRQALSELAREGLIQRQRGRGTFVELPRIPHGQVQLASFSDEMGALGKTVRARVLFLGQDLPDRQEAEVLGIPPDTAVTRFRRLRYVDGTPAMLARTVVLNEVGRHLTEAILQGSFYAFLRHQLRWPLTRATEEVEAGIASREEAHLLEIKFRSPVLRTRRVACTVGDRPFELTETVAGGNRVRIYLQLYDSRIE